VAAWRRGNRNLRFTFVISDTFVSWGGEDWMLASDKPVQTPSEGSPGPHFSQRAWKRRMLPTIIVAGEGTETLGTPGSFEPHSLYLGSSAALSHPATMGPSSRDVHLVATFQHPPSPTSVQLCIRSLPGLRHDEVLASSCFTMDFQREIQPIFFTKGS